MEREGGVGGNRRVVRVERGDVPWRRKVTEANAQRDSTEESCLEMLREGIKSLHASKDEDACFWWCCGIGFTGMQDSLT